MQIFARIPPPETGGAAAGPPEWAIVELQGDLESRSSSALAGQLIGDLHFTTQGAPVLIVGHHILWGKVAELEKPLLVMHKREQTVETSGDAMDTDSEERQRDDSRYHIQGVVKRKIIFKSRPKPIIANVPKKI